MVKLSLIACAILAQSTAAFAAGRNIVFLAADKLPSNMIQHNVSAVPAAFDGRQAVKVTFHTVDWPNVFFNAPEKSWDWSSYAGVAVDIYNPASEPVEVSIRVDNTGADGNINCTNASSIMEPKKWGQLRIYFDAKQTSEFWGMRGLPGLPTGTPAKYIDLSRVIAFQVFLNRPKSEQTLYLSNFRLLDNTAQCSLPFVDRFGQYIHADWPEKIKDEAGLKSHRESEEKDLKNSPAIAGRDKFGGWADGPKFKATGWFRTEKVDGKWWFITPEGHLFFSLGIDCVGLSDRTFIEKREKWFDQLPSKDDPVYGKFYSHETGAIKMAERINGQGLAYEFYSSNLLRKYGDNWLDSWRATTYSRLKSWGFNTIGNWSRGDVLDQSPVPFTATIHIGGDFRRVEGSGGWWGKMMDVFDPGFAESAEKSIAPAAGHYAGNQLCIGFFVDNELSWENIAAGSLASPPDQPCRIAQIEELKKKYSSLDNLNKTWAIDAKDWDNLHAPDKPNDACRRDLDSFCYAFARHYFEIVRNALRKHAPNHLYLGCRFAGDVSKPVVKACADVADVVSYNIYKTGVDSARWTGPNDIGKPIIIGEFHFGATDRGMFHPGLVDARSQAGRADYYARYVRSVIDCPAFIGCHWFQYTDEPLTGRCYDGENYNIGFVDITDTPYSAMVAAAKRVHAEVYTRRYGKH